MMRCDEISDAPCGGISFRVVDKEVAVQLNAIEMHRNKIQFATTFSHDIRQPVSHRHLRE